MADPTTIGVSEETVNRLYKIKKRKQSYDELINILIDKSEEKE